MSSGPVRRVSPKDIQVVQNLIERCLQLYMNQQEVVETLLAQAKIEPGFTELVWQKLEEENREFFKAYYLRLIVKQQINEFNKLLDRQVRLMQQINPTGVTPIPNSNGSHITSMPQNPACYVPEHTGPGLKSENIHHIMSLSLSNAFTNGRPPLDPSIHAAVEMPTHATRNNALPSILSAQGLNMGLMPGLDGQIIKSETGYPGTSPYMFGADGSVLEARPSITDASLSTMGSDSHPVNETLFDANNSYGYLSQIPQNFSLIDLTSDFAQSSDILENHPRSPFLATGDESFLVSREREHQGNGRRLNTISESFNYDEFGIE
uniref:Uncharacterized protein n=2 Tax=Rhizophora mucronata TaxID=61149 RepID=A0A2P2KHP3_RHIMU